MTQLQIGSVPWGGEWLPQAAGASRVPVKNGDAVSGLQPHPVHGQHHTEMPTPWSLEAPLPGEAWRRRAGHQDPPATGL